MRVFSKSLGKFIEAPSGQAGEGQRIPAGTMSGAGAGGGDMDPEMMRKLFAITALKNPKQASQLTSIYNLLEPKETATSMKKKTAMGDIERGLKEIERARAALKKSGTGLKYFAYDQREKFGDIAGIDKKATDTKSALSNVNTQLFKIAGTQFPKNEEALLGGLVLGIDKNVNSNLSSLDVAEQRLRAQREALSGGYRDSVTQDEQPPLSAFEE